MNAKAEPSRKFLPAAGHDLFLPLYDPLTKLLGGERARQKLVDSAAIQPGSRVLDIGCGTGTLVLSIRESHPQAEVVGFDPDPKALARAKRKAERAGVSVRFDEGFADKLPYPDASFDRVLSSMMFHHLEPEDRVRMLAEVRRVLKRGGSFHLMDFEGPDESAGWIRRLLHSHARLRDNTESRILGLMKEAGLDEPKRTGSGRLLFGRLAYYRAAA